MFFCKLYIQSVFRLAHHLPFVTLRTQAVPINSASLVVSVAVGSNCCGSQHMASACCGLVLGGQGIAISGQNEFVLCATLEFCCTLLRLFHEHSKIWAGRFVNKEFLQAWKVSYSCYLQASSSDHAAEAKSGSRRFLASSPHITTACGSAPGDSQIVLTPTEFIRLPSPSLSSCMSPRLGCNHSQWLSKLVSLTVANIT